MNSASRGEWGRRLLLTAYALFALAGPVALVYTPPVLRESIGDTWGHVWGAYVLFGGLGCLVGALARHWAGEYLFLNLLGSALLVYAVGAAFAADEPNAFGRVVTTLLVVATCLLLLDRWLEVREDARNVTGATCDTTKG